MSFSFFSWLSAIVIGVVMGLFGSGGSIVTVPALIYLFGQNEKVAIAGSLAIVGSIAFVASLTYLRKKLINWPMVVRFGLPAMVGTYLGAWLSAYVSGLFQLILFSVVMLLASILMLKPLKLEGGDAVAQRAMFKIILDGLVVGVITGLVGVGGGFLIVPALVLLGGLSMHSAVATSLIIVTMKSLTGFYKYIDVLSDLGLTLDWKLIGFITGLGIIGSFFGTSIAGRLPQQKLRKGFAVFLIIMGLYIFIKSTLQLYNLS